MSEVSAGSDFQGEFTRGVNNGESAAFNRIYREFRDRLRGLVRREMGQRFNRYEDSEDIVQQSLMAFYAALISKRVQLDHSRGLWPLLKQFTHHKILQRIDHYLRPPRNIRDERPLDVDPPAAGPSDQDAVDIVDQIEAALRQLLSREDFGPRDAQILRAKLRGESSKEIARQTNCSVAQVNRIFAWIVPRFEQALEKQAGTSPDRS
jgi:RNA polymerase sigma factor (sigma-70 family)